MSGLSLSRFEVSKAILLFSETIIISLLVVVLLFRDRQFIFMQDTFLTVSPQFLHEGVWFAWKQSLGTGEGYVNNGYLFYSILMDISARIGYTSSQAEFLYIFVLVLSTIGTFVYAVDATVELQSFKAVLVVLLGSFAYAFNIYTLSVNWFFIENWTAFAIILPLFLLVLYRITVNSTVPVNQILLLILVSQFFLYATTGVFAGCLLIFGLAFIGFCGLTVRTRLRIIGRNVAIVFGIVFLSELIDLIIQFNWVPYASMILSGYNIDQLIAHESSSTSLLSVFSLQGFIWLLTSGYLYPWWSNAALSGVMEALALLSIGFVFVFCALTRMKNKRGFYLSIAGVMALTIFLMKGSQPPFGGLFPYLVSLQFLPFDILINPYYFLGGIPVVLTFYVLVAVALRGKPLFRSLPIASYLALALICLTVASSSYIIATAMVYPNPNQAGNSIHQVRVFDLPPAYMQLGSSFDGLNASTRAAMLPADPLGDWTVDDGVLVETSYLANQLLPIPLITGETSPTIYPQLVSSALTHNRALGSLLALLNVKYVIFNGYSAVPSPENLNLSLSSDQDLSESTTVGAFTIYENTEPIFPLIYAPQQQICVAATNETGVLVDAARYLSGNASRTVGFAMAGGRDDTSTMVCNGSSSATSTPVGESGVSATTYNACSAPDSLSSPDRVAIASDPTGACKVDVSWSQVDPTEYVVHIDSNSSRAILVLQESFDPFWSLLPQGAGINVTHYEANGYANGWVITSREPINETLTIFYRPQTFYQLGDWLNVAVFGVTASLLVIVLVRRVWRPLWTSWVRARGS